MSKVNKLTQLARRFLVPTNATHRRYEALRAFVVERLSAAEAAQRFGYSPSGFRVLVHRFRLQPHRPFFPAPAKRPRRVSNQERLREQIVALRKQNLSIYDINRSLQEQGESLSAVAIANVLKAEGFARLPRRLDDERPSSTRPTAAAVADARALELRPRTLRTDFGGLFLFLPMLAALRFDTLMKRAGLPGSELIPAGHALRALLGLKLFGSARHSHVMSLVFDEGLALFAGLNVIPKRSPI